MPYTYGEYGQKTGVDKDAANILESLDIDESLGLEQVDEQIRDSRSTRTFGSAARLPA